MKKDACLIVCCERKCGLCVALRVLSASASGRGFRPLHPKSRKRSDSPYATTTRQAMFTEPADQSVWWYHHFLLTWADDDADSCCDSERYENVLRAEAATLGELIEVEGRCKVGVCLLALLVQ